VYKEFLLYAEFDRIIGTSANPNLNFDHFC